MTSEMNCGACGAELTGQDATCPNCGVEIAWDAAPPPAPAPAAQPGAEGKRGSARERFTRHAEGARRRAVHRAAVWILILAVVFAIGGTIFGLLASSAVAEEHRNAEAMNLDREQPVVIEGEVMTVGEYLDALDTAVVILFGANYFLAAVMLGLYFVTRSNPVVGTVTAFSVFVAVILLNLVVDPSSLFKGIIIKIFAIIALVGGMQAAFAQRAAERRAGRQGAGRPGFARQEAAAGRGGRRRAGPPTRGSGRRRR